MFAENASLTVPSKISLNFEHLPQLAQPATRNLDTTVIVNDVFSNTKHELKMRLKSNSYIFKFVNTGVIGKQNDRQKLRSYYLLCRFEFYHTCF